MPQLTFEVFQSSDQSTDMYATARLDQAYTAVTVHIVGRPMAACKSSSIIGGLKKVRSIRLLLPRDGTDLAELAVILTSRRSLLTILCKGSNTEDLA